MKRSIFAVCCVAAAVASLLAQAQRESLAGLIQAGDRKAALETIRSGADVNEAQPDGTRAIHWAVYRVDHELVEALLAKKAQVNVANEFGATPLAEAAKLADARLVKMLLDAGAEPEAANADGQTALMLAIKTAELPIVQMLVDAGAKVNVVEKFHNQTPLMWASADPNGGDIVKLLLAKGADVKPRALFTDWPSQITSEPRAQYRPTGGLTALLYAARDGCLECAEALIDAGADVNVPTPEGVTALLIALDNGHNDIAKLLLDRGANPHVWDWWGRTALYIAIDASQPGNRSRNGGLGGGGGRGGRGGGGGARSAVSTMDIVNSLIAAGVDLNPQLNMHRPSPGGNSGRFIDPLLNLGCTPLLRAVMGAAQGGDIEIVRLLLEKGANPNINAMGLTTFLVAAGVGTGGRGTGLAAESSAGGAASTALMDLLLAHGADVNAQITGTLTYSMRVARAPSANEGMTALHAAAQAGRVDMVQYLLDHGARTDILDTEGRKPLDMVAQRGALPPPPAAAGGGRGGRGGTPPNPEAVRTLLEGAAAPKPVSR